MVSALRNRTGRGLLLALAIGATGMRSHHARAGAPATAPVGNPTHGQALYSACTGCHSLDENDVGPKHRGVVGRHSGIVPGYAYSAALKGSGLIWTPANLNRWLTNPQVLVPGAKMYFSLAKAQDRADVVAYLATQR